MSKVISEKTIEKKVCDYAKSLGFLCYKLKSDSHAGLPDRMFIYMGTVLLVEFKRKGGRLSKVQQHVFSELKSHEVNVHVIDSVREGYELITEMHKKVLTRILKKAIEEKKHHTIH